MLVLHPKTSTLTAGAGVIAVAVLSGEGVSVTIGVSVTGAKGVLVITMAVAMTGVDVLPPITTGVGEMIEGVCVAGKKGVGWLYGDDGKNQSHDANMNIATSMQTNFFISSPPLDSTPHITKIVMKEMSKTPTRAHVAVRAGTESVLV
jgi:hypothetical protein